MPPKEEPVEVVADDENDEYATKKGGGPYADLWKNDNLQGIFANRL